MNPYGKSRPKENPYATYCGGTWEWRILKLYQSPENSAKNPQARALCAVKSEYTGDSFEIGDTYLDDIQGLKSSGGPDVLKQCGRRRIYINSEECREAIQARLHHDFQNNQWLKLGRSPGDVTMDVNAILDATIKVPCFD